MKTVKRIGVLSLAKLSGAIYAAIILIGGVLFSIVSAVLQFGFRIPGFSFLGTLGMTVVFAILYALLGFVGGALSAFVYNIVAKRVGGVTVEIE